MVGFRAEPAGARDPEPETGITVDALQPSYNVIVVGAGAGGGVAAAELARAGRHVLLVERARPHRNSELRGNHLQGKRLAAYDVTAGPGVGSPRVLERPDGSLGSLAARERQRLRLRPRRDDPRRRHAGVAGHGVEVLPGRTSRMADESTALPEDSTLANWPFGYDELAPYYDRVEWELGVSGDRHLASFGSARTPRRSVPYPMPPMPDDRTRLSCSAPRESARVGPTAIPFAINSVARDGRPACVRCSQCIGHACPVDAKNGTHNTFVPRAIASGNADLLTHAQVVCPSTTTGVAPPPE